MVTTFFAGVSRGGAQYTLAPEIAANQSIMRELNYEKADVWSLGVVLATMMATRDNFVDSKKQLLADAFTPPPSQSPLSPSVPISPSSAALRSVCMALITNIVTLSPVDRWSCHDVHRRTSRTM